MKQDIAALLRSNPYPGRGIIIGCDEDGKHAVVFYFIMGRSENSRNRVFVKTDDGIKTAAHDESKMTDPSLIIYHPLRVLSGITLVSNGDQTDTIREYLAAGETFHNALQTRQFEPDAPNYTPRISGIIAPDGAYILSILKTTEGDPDYCQRCFYEYPSPKPGLGHFISTYATDGDPLPSFQGEPIAIGIGGSDDFEGFTERIWQALDEDNKVSLYARRRNIKTGDVAEIIKNKHE